MTRDIVRARRPGTARPAGRRQRSTCCSSTGGRFEHPAWLDALHEMKAMQRGRADRRHRRHQFRRRASGAGTGRRHPDRQQPGVLLAGRPPRRGRSLSLLQAHGRAACSPMARCAAASSRRRWLGKAEPHDIADWSRSKYKRFIDAARRLEGIPGLLVRRA